MKNNMKKFLSLLLAVLMMASLSVTAFADEPKDFEGDSLSGDYDFYYTVTKEDVYTDISGVKLTWSVPFVKYTETDTLTWNTTDLKWVQTNSTNIENNEVSFTLTNRGSYAVIASASFALEDSLKKTGEETADAASVSFTGNNPTLNSIVNSDATRTLKETDTSKQEEYLTNNCTATIKGTVSIDNAAKLSTGSGKLGTYTVSIRNTKHTVTVSYYKNEGDASKTTETITVADDTKISCNGSTITIGSTTYTTQIPSDSSFDYWLCANAKIEDDITVNSDLVIDAIFAT